MRGKIAKGVGEWYNESKLEKGNEIDKGEGVWDS